MSNYSDSAFDDSNQNTSWYKIFNLIPQDSKVLDVGCSSGHFGQVLIERKNCTVDGIEIDNDDAVRAREHLRNVFVLDIERDGLSDLDTDYDVIYFGDVIEHLVQPAKALAKIKNLLKPTGTLVFSVPNMAHVAVRLALLEGKFEYSETGLLDKTHLHYYDREELERVLHEAGFELVGLDYVRKDYPRELITNKLEKIGLTGSDAFFERMSAVEASAFQWVGQAKPALKTTPVRRLQFGPVDDFQNYLNDIKTGHQVEVERLERQRQELEQELQRLNKVIEWSRKHPMRHISRQVAHGIKKRLRG